MKKYFRFLPLVLIPAGLAAVLVGWSILPTPHVPTLIHEEYQSFMGVLMLLMQF